MEQRRRGVEEDENMGEEWVGKEERSDEEMEGER